MKLNFAPLSAATLLAVAGTASSAEIEVMTQNQYVGTDLIGLEWLDAQPPRFEFAQDRVAGEDGHGGARYRTRMRHPYFDVPVPTVIGHRGACGEAPENTLVSFGLAVPTAGTGSGSGLAMRSQYQIRARL